jgi:hypothetical protein
MLTASLVAAVVANAAAAHSATPRPAKAKDVIALVEGTRGNPPRTWLGRLDPVNLAPKAPLLDLGAMWPRPDTALARSPDGKLAAVEFGSEDPAYVIDLRTMRKVVALPVTATLFAWVAPRRLIAVNEHPVTAAIVDPTSGSVVKTIHLGDWRTVADAVHVQGGVVLLLRKLGGPLEVVSITARGARKISLGRLWYGLERWPVRSRLSLPPGATNAVERSREDLAHREGIPPSAIQVLSVTPVRWGSSALECPGRGGQFVVTPGYQVVLEANARRFDYRGAIGGGAFYCQPASKVPAQNLLRAPRGAIHVTAAVLAADARSRRAALVAPEAMVVDIGVRNWSIRSRPLGRPLTFGIRSASWVGRHYVGVTTYDSTVNPNRTTGVRLIDVRSGKVRHLDQRPCELSARGDLALVYGLECQGLVGYGPDGRRRFSLFSGDHVGQLGRVPGYAYALLRGKRQLPAWELRVVDLLRGRTVNTASDGTLIVSER